MLGIRISMLPLLVGAQCCEFCFPFENHLAALIDWRIVGHKQDANKKSGNTLQVQEKVEMSA